MGDHFPLFGEKKHSSQVLGFADDSGSDNGLLKCVLTIPA